MSEQPQSFGERLAPRQPDELPPARPAATVILARQAPATGEPGTGIEVLLLQRSDHGVFGGMWVFPGGRVDDSDAGADDVERARSAAVRETLEEAGAAIDPSSLTYWSHWTPPAVLAKRYLTWFFIGEWPGGDIAVDDHEVIRYRWITPAQALAEHLPMAPPTIVTLAELITLDPASPAELRRADDDAPAYRTVVGRAADGTAVMLWDGDAGYSTADPNVPGPRHRLWMPKDAPARFERTD
jgi:8-oxo-dGTP pyrophosphatase MutT (NUDIX family)